jgi:C-terminal processing protease CtpA/Prc
VNDLLGGVIKGLSMLDKMNVTNLIIDVSNNGGGFVCVGQAFIQVLYFLTFFAI